MNKNLYLAALASKGMTQEDLAKKLEISTNTLRLKIQRKGDFKRSEIVVLYQLFGKKVVDSFLYE